jgi:hypothetical protein
MPTAYLLWTSVSDSDSSWRMDTEYQLAFSGNVPIRVMAALSRSLRLHLLDVRAMLRLPLPELGITAGCNYAALHALVNVVSGVSRLLGPRKRKSEVVFREFVSQHYPWRLEPSTPFRQTRGTAKLYLLRTAFAHDLGLRVDVRGLPGGAGWLVELPTSGDRVAVKKAPTLSPDRLDELDRVDRRPSWLGPTLGRDAANPGYVVVDVVALYWGVRRMVYDATARPSVARRYDAMLAKAEAAAKASGQIVTMASTGTPGWVLLNGRRRRLASVMAARRRGQR